MRVSGQATLNSIISCNDIHFVKNEKSLLQQRLQVRIYLFVFVRHVQRVLDKECIFALIFLIVHTILKELYMVFL